jgi:para-aminobenzoate synthetase component 1
MKGTIENDGEESAEMILSDPKELAEHVTIVDLIRNDLSMVANEVEVKRFRYLDEIFTRQKSLLQVSSEVTGILPAGYPEVIGDILLTLLPAGSVSGAPKPKTMEIIKQSEKEPRGYFTGVFGYFNGRDLDSGVMIRYIEKEKNKYYFRSGGGITVNSNPESEYKEMIDKVYVPIG